MNKLFHNTRSILLSSAKILMLSFLVCCVIVPALIFGVSRIAHPGLPNGVAMEIEGKEMSLLAGQPFDDDDHLWGRPMSMNFVQNDQEEWLLYSTPMNNDLSDPSYQSWKENLKASIEKANPNGGSEVPEELITASGSGMDPDITLEAALYQVPRIAQAKSCSEEEVEEIIESCKENGGLISVVRVNEKLDQLA